MKPLRISLLGAAASIHLQRWANALIARGHHVSLLSQHPCTDTLLDPAIERQWLPNLRGAGYLLNARTVRHHLREWQADLLHVHYATGYGSTAALSNFKPTLLSVWGSDIYEFPEYGPLHRAWLRRNLLAATAIASTSRAMAVRTQTLVPELKRIALTPFGVDMERFLPAPRPPGPFTVGTVKGLASTYGVDLLLRAFSGLIADPQVHMYHPDARLVIVGDGPDREALKMLAVSLGIKDYVQFVGAVPHSEVPKWLAQFDIYVAASRHESFGVAVVEASASGLPVVVSSAGGLPEVVDNRNTGLIVPVGDVLALQAALRELTIDSEARERFGRAGRSFVMSQYSWSKCVDRLELVYRELLSA